MDRRRRFAALLAIAVVFVMGYNARYFTHATGVHPLHDFQIRLPVATMNSKDLLRLHGSEALSDTDTLQTPDEDLTGGPSSATLPALLAPAVSNVPFGALIVFTMVRFDLLDLHLSSIDYPTKHVFVVFNYANEEIKTATFKILDKYKACEVKEPHRGCSNPNILELHVLTGPNNVGFAGSVNTGIKAMIEYNLPYAIFSGDDTRFRRGRLEVAKRILDTSLDVCIFHFEGYSSFGMTRLGIKRIGPMDENFWPAYAEDCDYWFRSQLVGCKVYYRGGYIPEKSTQASLVSAFIDHGDVARPDVTSSSTHTSNSELGKLVGNTLDGTRGRFAYLVRKWGIEMCGYYHETLNAWRDADVVLQAEDQQARANHGAVIQFPYNDEESFRDVRRWLRDDWRKPNAVSSRSVNAHSAPAEFVWQEEDYVKLDAL
jgi:hypothetical protein